MHNTWTELLLTYLKNTIRHITSEGKSVRLEVYQIIFAFYSQFCVPKKTNPKHIVYFTIPFIHNIQEKLNFSRILNCKDVKSFLPLQAKKFKIYVSYKYGPTIGQSIFNYNKVLSTLQVNTDDELPACDCNEYFSEFVYKPHGHVHTGNLDLIDNTSLRNIMKMGAKFRETPPCNKRKLTHLYEDANEKLTTKLARSTKSKSIIFGCWKDCLIQGIHKAFKSLPGTFKSSCILDKPEVRTYIKFLHDRFVIVPVDKASNNFGIVCKKFYLEVIKNELGISNDGNIIGNKVYKPVYQNAEEIYKFHQQKFWVHLVWNYSILISTYLYSTGLQSNINAHINSGLLQGRQNVTTNN